MAQDPARYPLELANVHLRHDQPARAVEELEKAEKLVKDKDLKAEIYIAWADACAKLKDMAKASQYFDKAMAATEDVKQRCRRALQYANKLSHSGRVEEAAKYFDYAVANSKQDLQQRMGRMQKISAFRRAGKLDELRKTAEATLAKSPKDEGALRTLYLIHTMGSPNQDKALEVGKRLAEVRPDDQEVMRRLARAYMGKRRPEEAVAIYEKLIQQNPTSKASLYGEILNAYRIANQHDKAIAWAKKLIEEQPDSARPWSQLADCYGNSGNTAKAIEAQEKAISLAKPGFEKDHMRLNLGGIYERAKRYREAKQLFYEVSEDAATPMVRKLAKRRLISLYERTGEIDKVKVAPPK